MARLAKHRNIIGIKEATGDLNMAYNQLQLALGLPGLDPIQRARYSARLEQVRAAMPKNRKGQVADDNRSGSGAVSSQTGLK